MRLSELFEHAPSRAYLFHGTDLNATLHIVADGRVESSSQYEHNPKGVSLTRSYKLASEFGTYWERDFPVVLVFDQERIRHRHKLAPRRDSWVETSDHNVDWANPPRETIRYRETEFEEMVLSDLPLLPALVSINIAPHELERALGQEGRDYVEYLKGEGHELTWRWWSTNIKKLAKNPYLNAWSPR